ncbi:hypothetical protein [Luteitalea sp.]|uniref:hypothetical protein n=1 Tax=Luteitalea sp. TaxID=2004800 RepID=UPI0025C14ECE|nr:hypothetical protein [Luteitalea sp.]
MSTTTIDTPTALAPTGDRTPAVIKTPDEYMAAIKRWEGHFHVLTPFTSMSGIAASYGLVVSQIRIHPDAAQGEVYAGLPFLKSDEVALAKIGLRKLAECAGISTETIRTDPRTIPHYWEVKAVATYTGIDGSKIRREATKEWDLRDGSAQLKGWTTQQIGEARKHGLRNCEARAINAVIRESGCGIRQKYSRAELQKPFVVVRVAFQPDLSDPEIKKLVTQSALSATSALYPAGRPAIEAAPIVDEPLPTAVEPRLVGSSATTAPSSTSTPPSSTTAGAAAPNPDVPPCEGAVRIVDVKNVKEGTSRNGGKWTLWKVIDGNGVEYSTLDNDVAAAAKKAWDAKAWVECITETKGEYTNLVELATAGQSPRLPLPGEGEL